MIKPEGGMKRKWLDIKMDSADMENPALRKTVLLILISILLLLLVGRFGAWHPVTPLHVAAQWKEVSFTRIKPAARQAGQKEDANVATIKVLKPEHPDSAGQSSDASQP